MPETLARRLNFNLHTVYTAHNNQPDHSGLNYTGIFSWVKLGDV